MYKVLLSVATLALVATLGSASAGAATIKGKVKKCKGCTVIAVVKKGGGELAGTPIDISAPGVLGGEGVFALPQAGMDAKGRAFAVWPLAYGHQLFPMIQSAVHD